MSDTIHPELARKIEPIRHELANATRLTNDVRYRIGVLVMEVCGTRAPYGAKAMQHLEASLGIDTNTLRRYQKVAKTWGKRTFNEMTKKEMENGQPLSWSHLDVLAEVAADRREELVRAVIDDGLSVRELKALLQSPSAAANEPAPKEPTRSYIGIRQAINKVEAVTRVVLRIEDLLVGGDGSSERLVALEEAATALTKLRDGIDGAIVKVNAAMTTTAAPSAMTVTA